MILQAPSMFEQYKMVMVVRADLKMGKGKVAAQVTSAVKKLLQCILFTYVSAYAHSMQRLYIFCTALSTFLVYHTVWTCCYRGLRTDAEDRPNCKF